MNSELRILRELRGRPPFLPVDPKLKAEVIARHHDELGMTYEEIARKFNVSRMTIWRWRHHHKGV